MNALFPNTLEARAQMSMISILVKHSVDYRGMSFNEMMGAAREFSAPCAHKWDADYESGVVRICSKCGGIQHN